MDDLLLRRVRPLVRLPVRSGRRALGMVTANRRLRPSWIILGVQKGGTTSLQAYLGEHPLVALPRTKEINYFNQHYDRQFAWYLGHFPLSRPGRGSEIPMTGEATAQYLSHRHVATRILDRLPNAKLLVLLRDPISRAFSHYNHECARGREPLSFEKALDAETARIDGEDERMRRDPGYYSYALRHYSYVWRGMYADQLERWFEHFPRKQILVLQSEALFEQPDSVYQRVLEFLGLPEYHPKGFPKHNSRSYSGLEPDIRERLSKKFVGPNERLFELIGERFDW